MSRSNRSAGSNSRILQLEEDNAIMERKLGMLKQAMSEERERRQSLKAASPGGGFWRTSGKGTADVRRGKPLTSARGKAQTRPRAAPAEVDVKKLAEAAPQQSRHQVPDKMRPNRVTDGGNTAVTKGSRGSLSATASISAMKEGIGSGTTLQNADHITGLRGMKQPLNRPSNAHEPETGMCCGTDDHHGQGGTSVFDGEVDEAANRREFLEALAAWRSGGTSETKKTVEGDANFGTSMTTHEPPHGAEAGIGTEMLRPRTKKPGPYFDKLMREAQARAAGEAAALKVGCKEGNTASQLSVGADDCNKDIPSAPMDFE